MTAKMRYQDLSHALKHMRVQIMESAEYAHEFFPPLTTPVQVWDYLKPRLTYQNDPKGVELFQTLETLMEDNFHGIPGAGDCDCFTIAALGTLVANGFFDCGIVLAGRSRLNAVHIWAYVNYNGSRFDLDFTQASFNSVRPYPFTQIVPLRLTNAEKKMYLQLAESAPHGRQPMYIYLPSQGVQMREDIFDGMSAGEFQQMCLSEGVPMHTIEQLSARRAERKATPSARQVRKEIKVQGKADARVTKQQTKGTARINRAAAKQTRADARVIKAQNPRTTPLVNYTAPAQTPQPQPAQYMQPEEYYEEVEVEEVQPEEYYEEEQPMEEAQPMSKLVGALTLLGLAIGSKLIEKSTRRTA